MNIRAILLLSTCLALSPEQLDTPDIHMITNLAEINKLIKHHSSDELVYIKNKGNNIYGVVLIDIRRDVSTDSISISFFDNIDLKLTNPISTGQGLEIDDLLDNRLNDFKNNYIPIERITSSLNSDFYKQNEITKQWILDEIGYTAVHKRKNPWRWAITFIKKTNNDIERKSFILENGVWILQKKLIGFYFSSCLNSQP